MFREPISFTAFNNEDANEVFYNIQCKYNDGSDASMLSTLRALFYPKLHEDESIWYTYHEYYINSREVENRCVTLWINCEKILRDNANPVSLNIISIHSDSDENEARVFECIDKFFESSTEYPGFNKIQKVSYFFMKSFLVSCFVNDERKSTMLFVQRCDNRRMHYLQCAMPVIVPWFLDKESGVSEEDMELLNSLREKTPEHYIACLEKMARKYNMREARLRRVIASFERSADEGREQNLTRQIERNNENIRTYEANIATLLRDIQRQTDELCGLRFRMKENANHSELLEYLLKNEFIFVENVVGERMDFTCSGYLSYFDDDTAKRYLDNTSSFFYNEYARMPIDDMVLLMQALFVDQSIQLKMCAAYRISASGGYETVGGHSFNAMFENFLPNPHIQHYNCLGSYRGALDRAIAQGDYVATVETCLASSRSLNISDSVVMEAFLEDVARTRARCFELPSGECVTPRDAIKYLKEQEEAK